MRRGVRSPLSTIEFSPPFQYPWPLLYSAMSHSPGAAPVESGDATPRLAFDPARVDLLSAPLSPGSPALPFGGQGRKFLTHRKPRDRGLLVPRPPPHLRQPPGHGWRGPHDRQGPPRPQDHGHDPPLRSPLPEPQAGSRKPACELLVYRGSGRIGGRLFLKVQAVNSSRMRRRGRGQILNLDCILRPTPPGDRLKPVATALPTPDPSLPAAPRDDMGRENWV